MKKTLRILHLEDDANDAQLIAYHLESADWACDITLVTSDKAFEAALAQNIYDLILSDNSGPSFNGLHTLQLAKVKAPAVPFIILTGTVKEDNNREALKQGAAGFVLKDDLSKLVPCMRQALNA